MSDSCRIVGISFIRENRKKSKYFTCYSLVFDGNTKLFVSIGMNKFENSLDEQIDNIKNIIKNKEKYIAIIKKQVEFDNMVADKEGLFHLQILDLKCMISEASGNIWPVLKVKVNDKSFHFVETGFSYALFGDNLNDYFSKINETRNAGAVEKPTFIFGNVRYSHLDNLYKWD